MCSDEFSQDVQTANMARWHDMCMVIGSLSVYVYCVYQSFNLFSSSDAKEACHASVRQVPFDTLKHTLSFAPFLIFFYEEEVSVAGYAYAQWSVVNRGAAIQGG